MSIKQESMKLMAILNQGVTGFSLIFRRKKRSRRSLEHAIRSQVLRKAALLEQGGRLYVKRIDNNYN